MQPSSARQFYLRNEDSAMRALMKNASRTSVASGRCSRATFQWRSRYSRVLCDRIRPSEIEQEAWGSTESGYESRQSKRRLCGGSGLGDGDGGFLGVGEWLNRPLVSNHVNGRDAYSGYFPTLMGRANSPTARPSHERNSIHQTSSASAPAGTTHYGGRSWARAT